MGVCINKNEDTDKFTNRHHFKGSLGPFANDKTSIQKCLRLTKNSKKNAKEK